MKKNRTSSCRTWLRRNLALFTLTASMGVVLAAEPPRPFPDPGRIRYDSHCLFIDNKPVFIYSGSFHYFRCPEALWPERFEKIKEAGFNAVETYVPWNWSEREMPASLTDYSKVNLTELNNWLTMAEHYGFYIIVRPGPYICAEWDTGGFPRWLLTKKPAHPLRTGMWLRSDDPVFLAWCKHWYNAVCPVIAKHQITRKPVGAPGVILVQLENEYNYAHLPPDEMLGQIKVLAQAAKANGINVPLFTCWTQPVRGATNAWLRGVFDSCNFYPRWNVNSIQKRIEQLRREQPDAPLMTAELQGGWFTGVGHKVSQNWRGLTASQINNLTLFAIQNGDTIINYYMLVGGTNPGGWAGRGITSSYDYHAPIHECGGVGARYQRVWALGHMLRKYGAELARANAIQCDVTVPQNDVSVAMRQAPDGSRFLFVRTSQHKEARSGVARVREKGHENEEFVFNYSLEPFGSKVLYLPPGATNAEQGQWLPKPAPTIKRPADLPPAVPIVSARCQSDPGPVHWKRMKAGQSLAQLGTYDNRFVFYRANMTCATRTNLLITFATGDRVRALINGEPVERVRGTTNTSVFALPAGSDKVQFLYENLGHANFGNTIGALSGIFTTRLVSDASDMGRPTLKQRTQEGRVSLKFGSPAGITDHWWSPAFNDAKWKSVPIGETTTNAHNLLTWYRMQFEMQPPKSGIWVPWRLRLYATGDGFLYLNGHAIGRYWQVGPQHDFYLPECWLHFGPGQTNVLALSLCSEGQGIAIQSAKVEPYARFAEWRK